ncbi:GGDEF domain-containing protein [Amycolatopsis regifaucium]|uniref:Diguanylate cyclase n=1 Tax=Amycolatopsis regifaucium TaxID=546365 RepID=A0A154MMX4_9PSEU|nr:GGDEF domain-containing protein [Amycolatopsis regifaucium]KZB85197.1 diguanylate cyclase [Amycolatopsis regifaucium]OKA03826.1 GGDEF domain-containing protein [Amycolatopsis regifaucium]
MAEVSVVADDEAALPPGAPGTDLLSIHESIAGVLATQGDWRRAYHHLKSAFDLARAGSLRDTLTSSYNRRYLDQWLHGPALDHRGPPGMAIALVDLDLFKEVNDTFGHLVGDRVLREVADLLQQGLPPEAFCARYGGEEFALVLPDVDAARAVRIADTARVRVARHPWARIRPGLAVTISVGLAHENRAEPGRARETAEPERQLRRADALLYMAKRAGRNKVAYRDNESSRMIPRSVNSAESAGA